MNALPKGLEALPLFLIYVKYYLHCNYRMPQYTSVQNRLSFILLWCCHVGHSFPSVQVVLQWPQSMPQLALFDLNIIITSNGICKTSEVILIVLLLYFLVPPMRDYIDINPWKNQCKPWGRLHKKKNKK